LGVKVDNINMAHIHWLCRKVRVCKNL